MKTAPLMSAFVLLALAGCKSSHTDASAIASSEAPAVSQTVSGAPVARDDVVTMSSQEFADVMAASDGFEIESSRIAVSQATSPAVKDFARKMIDSHAHSSSDLEGAGGREDPVVGPVASLNDVQKNRLEALRRSGVTFDRYYIDRQIEAHEQSLAWLKDYIAGGPPGPLRDLAERLIPNVTSHLAMARKLPR